MRTVLGIVAAAAALLAVNPAHGQTTNQPGQIRTSSGIPMRTGFSQPIRTTSGDYHRAAGGGGPVYGTYFPAYYTTGTSISITGDGFGVNLNGGLANQLAFNALSGNTFGYGSTNCIAVPDAAAVLPNLPSHVRNRVTVLYGVNYGWDYDVICIPGGSYGYSYGYGWYPSRNIYYRSGQPQTNTSGWSTLGQPGTQQPVVVQPAEPPEAIDVARVAIVIGDLEAAETQYREHLAEHPDDSEALREYALVMFDAERAEEGFAALRKAYRDDPALAARPLRLQEFGFDSSRTRRLMTKISPAAHRLKTSSAWMALAVILQWQDKNRAALRMLEKAEEIGLDTEIVTAVRAELTR